MHLHLPQKSTIHASKNTSAMNPMRKKTLNLKNTSLEQTTCSKVTKHRDAPPSFIQIYAQYLDVFRQTLWQLWRAKPLGATANWCGPKLASHVFIPIHTAKKFQFILLQTLFDDGDKASYHRFLRIMQTLWNSIDEFKPQTWKKGWRRSAFMISLHYDKWNHFQIKQNLTNLIPPVSVSHDASQRSCDFAQDIFGKAASSDASEPAGGVAMASQFASLQPVTWATSKRKTSITGAKVCFLSPNQCQSHNARSLAYSNTVAMDQTHSTAQHTQEAAFTLWHPKKYTVCSTLGTVWFGLF